MNKSSMDAIKRHSEQHIGKVESIWHELISDHAHTDMHMVPPSDAHHPSRLAAIEGNRHRAVCVSTLPLLSVDGKIHLT